MLEVYETDQTIFGITAREDAIADRHEPLDLDRRTALRIDAVGEGTAKALEVSRGRDRKLRTVFREEPGERFGLRHAEFLHQPSGRGRADPLDHAEDTQP